MGYNIIATSCNKDYPMSCAEQLSTPLRNRGFRMTRQRMTILHILNHDGGHLSPSQVYDRARQTSPESRSRPFTARWNSWRTTASRWPRMWAAGNWSMN